MTADIKLIRLSRITMEGKKYQEPQEDGTWFVADYFDIMQVNDLVMKQSFAEWLDIRRDDIGDYEIAEQSYTLYCSAAMLRQYELSNAKTYRGDPFKEESGMGCLSIIQVCDFVSSTSAVVSRAK